MLSSRIADLRKSVGLKQADLARHLHVTPGAVGMYEQGRRTPSIDMLIQIAHLFDVSLDYLLTGVEFSRCH